MWLDWRDFVEEERQAAVEAMALSLIPEHLRRFVDPRDFESLCGSVVWGMDKDAATLMTVAMLQTLQCALLGPGSCGRDDDATGTYSDASGCLSLGSGDPDADLASDLASYLALVGASVHDLDRSGEHGDPVRGDLPGELLQGGPGQEAAPHPGAD